jgi:hypothetical protein
MTWNIKGTWHESCASEGHCSFYFGRDREEPCKQIVVYDIKEGEIDGVDVSGVMVVTVADLYSEKVADLMMKGGEGGIYISDKASEEQRKALESFFVNNVPGMSLLRKCLGVRYVDMEYSEEGDTCRLKMPQAEWEASLTRGGDGRTPQRIENSVFGRSFPVLNICNTRYWRYNDFGKNWDFKNRSGARAEFDMKG